MNIGRICELHFFGSVQSSTVAQTVNILMKFQFLKDMKFTDYLRKYEPRV